MAPKAVRGLNARLAAAAAAPAAAREVPSSLASLLLKEWVWGHMPATQVQRLASAAVSDGADHRELRLLASIGTDGSNPGNCHRDLVEYRLRKPLLLSALTDIKVWVRKPPLHSIEAEQKILLPHQLIGDMYLHHPESFTSLILGGGPARPSAFRSLAVCERQPLVHPQHLLTNPPHHTAQALTTPHPVTSVHLQHLPDTLASTGVHGWCICCVSSKLKVGMLLRTWPSFLCLRSAVVFHLACKFCLSN
jgi:hypothetical protein